MIKRLFIVALFVLFAGFSYAQVLGEEEQSADQTTTVLTTNTELTQATFFQQTRAAATNGIFIRQIGSDNFSRVVTGTSDSGLARVDLLQQGDNNYANIVDSSQEFLKNVVQNGDGNRLYDYSLPSNLSTNFQLIQNGNNLYVEKFGTNSLTEDLKINMTGNARSVIIRSF